MKARAAAGLGLGPDVAAVAAHDALHRRQADAGAGEVVGAVQALEDAEQPVGIAHVEAGAVVAHVEDLPAALRVRSRTATAACGLRALYFQALPSRFSSTRRSSVGSPSTTMPGSISTSTWRSGAARRRSSTT